jgi:selenide,water dikinase
LDESIDQLEASLILPDPQTNGGLLIAVDPTALQEVQDILKAAGIVYTEPIGVCTAASDKKIVITA